jgi:hypothetical protein
MMITNTTRGRSVVARMMERVGGMKLLSTRQRHYLTKREVTSQRYVSKILTK